MNHVILDCIEKYLNCVEIAIMKLVCRDYYFLLSRLRTTSCIKNSKLNVYLVIQSSHKYCKKYYRHCNSYIPRDERFALARQNEKMSLLVKWDLAPSLSYFCNHKINPKHCDFIDSFCLNASYHCIRTSLIMTVKKRYIPHEECFFKLLQRYPNECILSWSSVNKIWYHFSPALAKKIIPLNFRKDIGYIVPKHMQDELLEFALSSGYNLKGYQSSIFMRLELKITTIPFNTSYLEFRKANQLNYLTISNKYTKTRDFTYAYYVYKKLWPNCHFGNSDTEVYFFKNFSYADLCIFGDSISQLPTIHSCIDFIGNCNLSDIETYQKAKYFLNKNKYIIRELINTKLELFEKFVVSDLINLDLVGVKMIVRAIKNEYTNKKNGEFAKSVLLKYIPNKKTKQYLEQATHHLVEL